MNIKQRALSALIVVVALFSIVVPVSAKQVRATRTYAVSTWTNIHRDLSYTTKTVPDWAQYHSSTTRWLGTLNSGEEMYQEILYYTHEK